MSHFRVMIMQYLPFFAIQFSTYSTPSNFPLVLLRAWQENQARAHAQAKQQGRKIPSLLFLEIEALSLVKSTIFSACVQGSAN